MLISRLTPTRPPQNHGRGSQLVAMWSKMANLGDETLGGSRIGAASPTPPFLITTHKVLIFKSSSGPTQPLAASYGQCDTETSSRPMASLPWFSAAGVSANGGHVVGMTPFGDQHPPPAPYQHVVRQHWPGNALALLTAADLPTAKIELASDPSRPPSNMPEQITIPD